MKGQGGGGQLFNKGHVLNKYIFTIRTHSSEYISILLQSSCDALVNYVSYKIVQSVDPTSVTGFLYEAVYKQHFVYIHVIKINI